MRIWLQKFVSIQPRTSLEKSDVSWPTARQASRRLRTSGPVLSERERRALREEVPPCCAAPNSIRHRRTFDGPFSAVSTATIARVVAFFRIFRDLQDVHSFAPLQNQSFSKFRIFNFFFAFFAISRNFCAFSAFFHSNLIKISRIFTNFEFLRIL